MMGKNRFHVERSAPLFRYAIIADTHFRPVKGDESSPWEVNKYANGRARWVIHSIKRSNPDFMIHMGDVVHPLPHLASYGLAAEAALKELEKVDAPVYYVPGNHDVGDKNNPMMPAYVVDDFSLDQYVKWFGPLYRSFDHKGVHFIIINALALNSQLPHEDEHSRWLEEDMKANKGKRIHIFSHYPPYVLEPGEPSYYDNIDEPARSWLLGLLERYEAEAFFSAHVHHFFYHNHGASSLYNVFATSFVRQDYSEMFRVEAADEYGRNDVGKLGWCTVDVYEDAHIARIHRSNGMSLGEGETPPSGPPKIEVCRTKEKTHTFIGVHLRHPWAEEVDLPYNGPLDEFVRKRVRNDYPLLCLWECGIRRLRVPLRDLNDEKIRLRIKALTEMGHLFSFFSFGIPNGALMDVLKRDIDLVDSLEIVLPWRDVERAVTSLLRVRREIRVPLFLANIESSADRFEEGSKFSHYVSYGFRPSLTKSIEEFLTFEKALEAADGFVFQVGANESPWDSIKTISGFASIKGVRAVVNVRLASENPAEYLQDDVRVANRVCEAMACAAANRDIVVFLDTFTDLDRGYFPRVGLYDRRYNRRAGSFVLSNMRRVLHSYGPDFKLGSCHESDDG